jgi:hypothetical protein
MRDGEAVTDDRVLLQPEEIEALPEMLEWKRATKVILEHADTEWVIRFLRNFADRLEAEMMLVDDDT